MTLSIGGNDALFGKVVTKCIMPTGTCYDSPLADDTLPMSQTAPAHIANTTKEAIKRTLVEIHKKAPRARVVLMGYPTLFEADYNFILTASCLFTNAPGLDWVLLSQDEAKWLNQMGTTMLAMMDSAAGEVAAMGYQASFANPEKRFEHYRACSTTEGIHQVVLTKTASDTRSPKEPSAQSFHPNPLGASRYTLAINEELRLLGW